MRRKFHSLVGELHRYEAVSVDVETNGKYWYKGDRVFGVAIAGLRSDGTTEESYVDIRDDPRAVEALAREGQKWKRIVNHTIKFDAHMSRESGFPLPPDAMECTSTRAALINEHEPHYNLDALGEKYTGYRKDNSVYEKLAALFGGKPTREAQIGNLHRAPAALAEEYAIKDPVAALHLWKWQEAEIEKQGLGQVWALERELLPVLIDVERHGVRVDVKRTEKSQADITRQIAEAERELDKLCGRVWGPKKNESFNANSSPQKRELWGVRQREDGGWETDTGYPLEKTDGGQASIPADVLRALAESGDKRAELVHKISKFVKARSFLTNHILGHAVGGRVFPNYNTTRGENDLGTRTGRFSIDDPALQQIPARDVDIAEIVRSCFLPDEGYDWLCSDWQQFEFRWFAHYVNEPSIIQRYHDDPDSDFHRMAAEITGLPRSPRFAGDANAKQINLGLVFGMGQGRLAAEMGLPYKVREDKRGNLWYDPGPEAIQVFQTYHTAIPGVQKLLSKATSLAKSRGYVITASGRHLRFPGGRATHKAGGLVFQGTSADCMKRKMIELHRASKTLDFRLMLSVHDESDHSIPKGARGKKVAAAIKEISETFDGVKSPIACRVPIRASVAIGPNWFEASK